MAILVGSTERVRICTEPFDLFTHLLPFFRLTACLYVYLQTHRSAHPQLQGETLVTALTTALGQTLSRAGPNVDMITALEVAGFSQLNFPVSTHSYDGHAPLTCAGMGGTGGMGAPGMAAVQRLATPPVFPPRPSPPASCSSAECDQYSMQALLATIQANKGQNPICRTCTHLLEEGDEQCSACDGTDIMSTAEQAQFGSFSPRSSIAQGQLMSPFAPSSMGPLLTPSTAPAPQQQSHASSSFTPSPSDGRGMLQHPGPPLIHRVSDMSDMTRAPSSASDSDAARIRMSVTTAAMHHLQRLPIDDPPQKKAKISFVQEVKKAAYDKNTPAKDALKGCSNDDLKDWANFCTLGLMLNVQEPDNLP